MPTLTFNIPASPAVSTVAIEDYMWELTESNNLQPRDISHDFNEMWDVDDNGNFMPGSTLKLEGYYELDPDGNIRPK